MACRDGMPGATHACVSAVNACNQARDGLITSQTTAHRKMKSTLLHACGLLRKLQWKQCKAPSRSCTEIAPCGQDSTQQKQAMQWC